MSRKFLLLVLFVSSLSGGRAQGLTATRLTDGIEISEGSEKVLFYQISPKSRDGKFERANYVHPLYSLTGEVLTEDFPEDHPHHRGIFWAWHQIIVNGQDIGDSWSCRNISWKVSDSRVKKRRQEISIMNEVNWVSQLNGAPEAVVKEQSMITVYAREEEFRIIDFDIHLAALVDDLKIGGSPDAKGYGGFSLRVKLPEDIAFRSEKGNVAAQLVAVDAGPWMDFYGSLEDPDKPQSGVALFCHPSNPGYPQPWILRAAESMQNVVFPGNTPVSVSREGIRLHYRLVIHNDRVGEARIKSLFQEYADHRIPSPNFR